MSPQGRAVELEEENIPEAPTLLVTDALMALLVTETLAALLVTDALLALLHNGSSPRRTSARRSSPRCHGPSCHALSRGAPPLAARQR